jgi:hypothetical protein
MAAGLESDIGGACPGAVTCLFQRDNFGVVPVVVFMEALADRFVAFGENTADSRIGRCSSDRFLCQLERAMHPPLVLLFTPTLHRDCLRGTFFV